MDSSLQKLMKVMPPIKGQRHTKVNWGRLEESIGLTYPDSFKEFVSVYGSSHWFDKLLPFYSTARTVRFVEEYGKSVQEKLKPLAGNLRDAKFKKINDLPLHPEKAGLFPFLVDIDGPLWCWLTKAKNPNRWPVYCWMTGVVTALPDMTISGILLGFLERSPQMIPLLGDVRDYPASRIRIDDVCAEG